MLIKDRIMLYLAQDIEWERVKQDENGSTLYNENGEAMYSAPVYIKGRKIGKHTHKVDSTGSIIACDTFVVTYADVVAEDKLDGIRVVSSKDILDKYGEKVGVECYL